MSTSTTTTTTTAYDVSAIKEAIAIYYYYRFFQIEDEEYNILQTMAFVSFHIVSAKRR